MSLKGRAIMRGKRLDRECYKASPTTNEYGELDKRVFCLGLMDASTEEECEECRVCNAFWRNAEPL